MTFPHGELWEAPGLGLRGTRRKRGGWVAFVSVLDFLFHLNYSLGMDGASVRLRAGAGCRQCIFWGRRDSHVWVRIIGALCYWRRSPWAVGVWVGTWTWPSRGTC